MSTQHILWFCISSYVAFWWVAQVIEKDLNAALDQQRAASLARSSHKNNNSKGKGKSKGKHASSNAFDSSNGGDGGDGGDGGNEEDGEGEGGGEDEEMDSKVAALVDELAAARRAHEDTETRLQREVEALRTQVKEKGKYLSALEFMGGTRRRT